MDFEDSLLSKKGIDRVNCKTFRSVSNQVVNCDSRGKLEIILEGV